MICQCPTLHFQYALSMSYSASYEVKIISIGPFLVLEQVLVGRIFLSYMAS